MLLTLFAGVAYSACTDDQTMQGFDNVHTAKNTCEWDAGCVFMHVKDYPNESWSCESERTGGCNNNKNMQCGGHSFEGQTCCPADTKCYKRDHEYSECKKKCPKGKGWKCEDDQPEEPATTSDYHCMGEIASFNEACAELDNQDECENFRKGLFSDGVCDWKMYNEDDRSKTKLWVEGSMWEANPCDESTDSSWVSCEEYARCALKDCADTVTAKNSNWRAQKSDMMFNDVCDTNDCVPDPCECKDEFHWDGQKYDECAVTEEDGESWCYVKGGAACAEATESTKNEGMFYIENCGHDCDCKEMFLFEGTVYTECTMVDDTKPWCYVKGYDKCEHATESTKKAGHFYRYCESEQCPSQVEIDELPAASAQTKCEAAGCVYTTDKSNPFKTVRMCDPKPEETDPCECKDEFYWDGQKHDECTVTEEKGLSWCYVKGGAACAAATESTKNQGMFYIEECGHGCDCKDEFEWMGKTYSECTTDDEDSNRPWCYVQDGSNCEYSSRSLTNLSESWKYCPDGCPHQMQIDELPAASAQTVCEDAGCEYKTDNSNPFKTKRMCTPKAEESAESSEEEGCPTTEELMKLPAMSAQTTCEQAGCKYSTDKSNPFKTIRMCDPMEEGCPTTDELMKLPAMSARTTCEQAGCVYTTDTSNPFKTIRMCDKEAACTDQATLDKLPAMSAKNKCEMDGKCVYKMDTSNPFKTVRSCVKKTMECMNAEEDQCAGMTFMGQDCCPTGMKCFQRDVSYSACKAECPMGVNWECEPEACEGDKDKYTAKLFNEAMSGVNDCMSAVRFLELQALGDPAEGCKIPLENMVPFMIFNEGVELKYETLGDFCCDSCKKAASVCTLDADSYVSEDGTCARGEESFELYCGQVNCIRNSDCKESDFDISKKLYKCDECLMENTIWKGKAVKKKADSMMECYEMCAESKGFKDGQQCKAYSFLANKKKNCQLFSKAKKTKAKDSITSGKKNCHPTKGKQRK